MDRFGERYISRGTLILMVRISAVAAIAAAAVWGLNRFLGIRVADGATAVGSVVTAGAVLLAYHTLRATHEWNRRQYTIELSSRWNREARIHLAFLEHKFPRFFVVPDFVGKPEVLTQWKMDAVEARRICDANEADAESVVVRDHLIELFNHFENTAMAYEQFVVDRPAIEDSFGQVMTDTYIFFQPFVDEMRKLNRSDPWPPLSRVVGIWLSQKQRQHAEENARKATKQFKEALVSAQENLKQLTER